MGRGVKKDFFKAVEWYSIAAERGDSWSQNDLANCYLDGLGVEQNYDKAIDLFLKSANLITAMSANGYVRISKDEEGIYKDAPLKVIPLEL